MDFNFLKSMRNDALSISFLYELNWRWEKCNVPIKIKHYFQTNAGGYSEQLLEEALKALEAENTGSVSVRIGNSAEAKSGTVYYKDESKNEILCVSMQEDGREAFYLVESVSSDEIIVSEADLFAITDKQNLRNRQLSQELRYLPF